MERKKKLRLIQTCLLVIGVIIISYTYFNKDQDLNKNIISKETQKKIKKNIAKNDDAGDVFYDISYNGIDLSGNRYIIKSKEAINNESQSEIVSMKGVNAFFYFKDNTILEIQSEIGVYNNKTLDMKFEKNVIANYEGSVLTSEKAEYFNSKNFLTISNKVKIKDVRGELSADQLLFDLQKQTLDIKSFEDNKINANLN
tara:strand:- start:7477 stop:8073 length:597 start_codon:yes stop_codon:yes gene_type:complete